MIIKQTIIKLCLFFLLIAGANLLTGGVVQAACADNAGTNDPCYAENYDSIPDKRGFSLDDYNQAVQGCRGQGGVFGIGGADEGSCSNVVANCIRYAVNTSTCEDGPKMGEISPGACNDTPEEGAKVDCVAELNEPSFNEAREEAAENMRSTCSGDTAAAQQNCNNDAQAAANACSTGDFSRSAYSSYNSCLQDEGRKLSRNQAECSGRDGVWSNGKCNVFSDFKDSASCGAVGGEFKITGNSGGQDVWSCTAPGSDNNFTPDSPNNPNNVSPQDQNLPGSFSTPGEVSGEECGGAKVLLVPCQGEGAEAIASVLKVVLNVMTVGVGIAAVGGVAYGAVLYAGARDNAGQTAQAITIIRTVIIGVLMYIFMAAILNWLVPGVL